MFTHRAMNWHTGGLRLKKTSHLSTVDVDHDVVEMTIAEADDVADDAHDGRRAVVGLRHAPPLPGARGAQPQLSGDRNTGIM